MNTCIHRTVIVCRQSIYKVFHASVFYLILFIYLFIYFCEKRENFSFIAVFQESITLFTKNGWMQKCLYARKPTF
jgi:hypothetical protein